MEKRRRKKKKNKEEEEEEIACYYYSCEPKESPCKRISAYNMRVYGKPELGLRSTGTQTHSQEHIPSATQAHIIRLYIFSIVALDRLYFHL
jgi:hypothetical protein